MLRLHGVELESYPGIPEQFAVIEGDYGYTVNNNAWIWTLDKDSGEVLSKYACFEFENWDGTLVNATDLVEIGPCVSAQKSLKMRKQIPDKGKALCTS